MKKVALLSLAGLALVAFSLTSCKKEWDCTCKVTVVGYESTTTVTSGKLSKSDAETWCNSGDSAYSECELD